MKQTDKEIITPKHNSRYKPLLAVGLRRLVHLGYLVLPRQQSALKTQRFIPAGVSRKRTSDSAMDNEIEN